ncbi:hypothetical protein EV182_001004 [Spiromyces aspiralis]|uniref:Uncharacterized protein n=1 Tax=Spiromyces aspiralis TaxID=68401 RepID=A0ACC1HUE1_9FUNG|nr:hypothetical protein EV182_001004 [Spiromyces aspiralis]
MIIYTGGTIGMKHKQGVGYSPVKGYLPQELAKLRRFHDPEGFRDFESYSRSNTLVEDSEVNAIAADIAQMSVFSDDSVTTAEAPNQQQQQQDGAEDGAGSLKQDRINIERRWFEDEGLDNKMRPSSPPSSSNAFGTKSRPSANGITTDAGPSGTATPSTVPISPSNAVSTQPPSMSVLSDWLITPRSLYGKRIKYCFLEYDPLLDSCNISMKDWSKIVSDIERYYHSFDAFVVLHGTDTMVYTASALSFMLEDLGKPVIITGAQVPFSEIRNDAVDNLLGALTIAGHFMIPEVSLYFHNAMYRGNRCVKVNAMEFQAFDSPNLAPLVKVGVNIEVNWPEVIRPNAIRRFKAHKNMDCNVATLRLFPGITGVAVSAFLSSGIKGIVLETYGAGNAPDDRPDLLQAFKEASDRGVVIAYAKSNQIKIGFKGAVSDLYATARGLAEVGVCALTKLSFLLGLGLSSEECRVQMGRNLCGELTLPISRQIPFLNNSLAKPTTYIQVLAHQILLDQNGGDAQAVDNTFRAAGGPEAGVTAAAATNNSSSNSCSSRVSPPPVPLTSSATAAQERGLVWRSFLPVLWCAAASTNDLQGMQTLLAITQNKYDVTCYDYNGRTPLHCAAREGNVQCMRFLLRQGASVHVLDRLGHTPLLDAVLSRRIQCVRLLIEADAHFSDAETKDWMHILHSAVSKGDTEMIHLLQVAGADLYRPNMEGHTALHLAVTRNQVDVVRALLAVPKANPCVRNYWGETPLQLAQKQVRLLKTLGMAYSEEIVVATEVYDLLVGAATKCRSPHCCGEDTNDSAVSSTATTAF